MNDQLEPTASDDTSIPRFTWWDHRGSTEWAELNFEHPQLVSEVEVYWWDERRLNAHCRVPKSWRVLVKEGTEWKPVSGASEFGTNLDQFNRVTFTPTSTTAIRLQVQLQPEWSGGILEWRAH